jgi:hypothetical protein
LGSPCRIFLVGSKISCTLREETTSKPLARHVEDVALRPRARTLFFFDKGPACICTRGDGCPIADVVSSYSSSNRYTILFHLRSSSRVCEQYYFICGGTTEGTMMNIFISHSWGRDLQIVPPTSPCWPFVLCNFFFCSFLMDLYNCVHPNYCIMVTQTFKK